MFRKYKYISQHSIRKQCIATIDSVVRDLIITCLFNRFVSQFLYDTIQAYCDSPLHILTKAVARCRGICDLKCHSPEKFGTLHLP